MSEFRGFWRYDRLVDAVPVARVNGFPRNYATPLFSRLWWAHVNPEPTWLTKALSR